MLYSINGKLIVEVPHWKQRRRLLYLLSSEDLECIKTEIESRIYSDMTSVAEYTPADWNNSVFKPLYVAAGSNDIKTTQFLGIILWEILITHDRDWVPYDLYSAGIKNVVFRRKETA